MTTITTTRRGVTAVTKGDTVVYTAVSGRQHPARVTRVTTEPGWVRLDFRYTDGSREHAWYETHEGVEVAS